MWDIPVATAYGGILLTRGGRILLREPANHYDGYVWTYAKGRPGKGDTPERAALREVREETGYEAEIVDVLPGVFEGGTTANAFFVMRHIGPPSRFDERETASMRWVDFYAAEKLIARTTNAIGRTRDLAILKAARAWFEANHTVVLPDDEYPPFPAHSYDCPNPIQPMPAQHISLPVDLVLSASEARGVRMGFIPPEQEYHWFAYFQDDVLNIHRSWTGFCYFRLHFVQDAEGLRATHVEVNRDPAQHPGGGDREDLVALDSEVRFYAARIQDEAPVSSLQAAIELASQPNYLGSPEAVASLVKEFIAAHEPGPTGLPDWSAKQAANQRLTRVMCEDGTGYTRMPGWHTEAALGQNLITAFNLDPDYCAGEDLTFLVSETLAALSMAVDAAIKAIGEAVAESENPEDHEQAEEALQALFNFVVWSFLGTQMVMAPGTTLRDFQSGSSP